MNSRSPLIAIALGAALLLGGCGQEATPPPEPSPTPVPPTPAPTVLEVVALDGSVVPFTMAELQALPLSEGWSGIKTSTGEIHVPEYFQTVSLADLAEAVGGLDDQVGVNIVAADGYAITFSYEQIMSGDFITYDPATGDEITLEAPPVLALAYARDGAPLDEAEEGALRAVVISPENSQVVDGHWSVKWVNRIEFVAMAAAWTIHLEGGITEDLDRGSFESCGAANCHQAEWTDGEGRVWAGFPLWLILGRADDDVQHGDGAFNDALAALPYTVEVVASDGYAVEFDSTALARNDTVLIADLRDGEPLPEDEAPLRLVGPDLVSSQSISMIAGIVLHIPETGAPGGETVVPTPAAGEEIALTLTGAVRQELSISMEGLRAMGPVTVEAEHPSHGMQTFEGFRLSTLLDAAGLADEATTLVLVASDGYEVAVPLADLEACPDCMLAFTEEGGLDGVMPGFPGNMWNKGVVSLRVE